MSSFRFFFSGVGLSADEEGRIEKEGKERRGEGWGKPFKVEWVKVSRLPFSRTR